MWKRNRRFFCVHELLIFDCTRYIPSKSDDFAVHCLPHQYNIDGIFVSFVFFFVAVFRVRML